MELIRKKILIISPQHWGKMYLAKHHYAIELAKRGNEVYFLNPPEQRNFGVKSKITIKNHQEIPNLYLIDHSLFFPYSLRFHLLGIFNKLMAFHIRILKNKLPDLDIIWSFDLGNLYPFKKWNASHLKIFHPVDEPQNLQALKSAEHCDIIFSVTKEILLKYDFVDVPKIFINHGISEEFNAKEKINKSPGIPIRVGFSGNLVRNDIDRKTVLDIIRNCSDFVFEFFGPFEITSNLGGTKSDELNQFIKQLKQSKNVILHGIVSPEVLAHELERMDLLLICYDIQKDQSKGTNYHKVMEYLSTGRRVVANNITTYTQLPGLIAMCQSRESNVELLDILRKEAEVLIKNNENIHFNEQITFASENTYAKNILKIEQEIQKYHG